MILLSCEYKYRVFECVRVPLIRLMGVRVYKYSIFELVLYQGEEGEEEASLKFHDLLQIPNKFTTDYLRAKRQVPTMSENMETAMLSMEMEKKEESGGPRNINDTTKNVGITK